MENFYSQGLKFEEVVIYFESVVIEFKVKKIKKEILKSTYVAVW